MREHTEVEFRDFCESRKRTAMGTSEELKSVSEILDRVRAEGDFALREYTKRFDGVQINTADLQVSSEEIEQAYSRVSDDFLSALKQAKDRIEYFHRPQKQGSWFEAERDGSVMGLMRTPLDSVGIYVPGGTALYPSSVLMSAIPAKLAGVTNISICTPPGSGGEVAPGVLVAAHMVGVDSVYRVGGAQAIAAMTFGTETVRQVDKIVGPGNIYVTLAKKLVYGSVDIDMLAGPSEVLVIADDTARADYVAADLLSQAEHDPLAGCVLISTCRRLLQEVQLELTRQLSKLERKDIAESALRNGGALVWAEEIDSALDMANLYAPEHLEIMTRDPFSLIGQVRNAGAVFLGGNSPEAMGDYVAGSNHVLPTGGTARFASGLGVASFMKTTSLTMLSRVGFERLSQSALTLAQVESLSAHAEAVKIRLRRDSSDQT